MWRKLHSKSKLCKENCEFPPSYIWSRGRKRLQWKRCLERVSFGIYSATNRRSSPSAQQPIRFTILLCRTLPTPEASICRFIQEKSSGKTIILKDSTQCLILEKYFVYHKLLGIRPWLFGESFNGNKPIVLQLASINHVWCFLSTLWDNQVTAKSIGSRTKLRKTKLFEHWNLILTHLFSICFYHQNLTVKLMYT